MNAGLDRFGHLLDVHGADPGRWPAQEREAALALVEAEPAARALLDEARALDAALDALPAPRAAPDLRLRVLAAAPSGRTVPARATPFAWLHRLGRWTLAGPALAGALALGLAVGHWLPMPEPALSEAEFYALALMDDSDLEFEP